MKHWGRVSLLVTLGTFMAAGCGGRTGGLYEDGGPEGSGASIGVGGAVAVSTSGKPGKPGQGGKPGRGGSGQAGFSSGGSFSTAGAFASGGGFPTAGRGGGFGFGGINAAGNFNGGAGFGGFSMGGGGSPSGACCQPQQGPSCARPEIAKCVCAKDSYCCATQWDDKCAAEVEELGCGSCGRNDCQGCLGEQCSMQLSACFQDFRCLSIFECMQATGCQAFDCYNDQTCRFVIDSNGGLQGPAMNTLLVAYSCAILSGCPCN